MKSLDNVPRIEAMEPAAFLDAHLRPQVPVILTNLYDGDPIASIRTREDAMARWAEVPLPVQVEYMTRAAAGMPIGASLWRVGDFLALPEDDPMHRAVVITEQDTPAAIADMMSLPAYADLAGVSRDDAVSKVFIAHGGHYAHLHYDMDGRPVFLTQVFGRKRVMVIEPRFTQALDPVLDERGGNMSGRFLEHFTEDERLDFAREMQAHDCVLEPGETIFIPTAWWHYIDYVDTGMSFNVRIGRSDLQQRLFEVCDALESRHLHMWQAITQPFTTGREPSAEHAALAEALLDALARARQTGDVDEFAERLEALYRAVDSTSFTRVLRKSDERRLAPIERLFDFDALVGGDRDGDDDEADDDWEPSDVPRLADGITVARALGDGDLLVLRDNEAIIQIGAQSEGFAEVTQLLERLARGETGDVAAHADAIGCRNDEIAELLAELGDVGCVTRDPR